VSIKTIFSVIFYSIIILLGIAVLSFLSEFDFQLRKTDPQWEMVWSDEFNTEGRPDDNTWQYDLGDGCPLCGWGNNELQYYTDSLKNVRIENGHLIIQVHKENIGSKKFSSTRIKSKKDIKYGKVAVRLKNPSRKGVWPAVWMLPSENKYGRWPQSGEIDIMEHVGFNPDSIFGTVHTEAYNHLKFTQKMGRLHLPKNEDAFYEYSIEWNEEKIDFLVDGSKYFTFENEKKNEAYWPFDQKFHLIINLAIGGNWGGKHGVSEEIVEQKMEIDYVRVYKDISPKKLF